MSNFVTDLTTLPDGKSDLTVIPVAAVNKVVATEWNTSMQALYDLRGQVLAGNYSGLTDTTTTQAVAAAAKSRLRLNGTNLEVSIDGGSYHILSTKAPEIYSPLTYGAKFDDSTDDSASFVALFTAITASGTAQVVRLPAGRSYFSKPLHISYPCTLFGAGQNLNQGTTLRFAAGQHGVIVDSAPSSLLPAGNRADYSVLRDFAIIGGKTTAHKHGLTLRTRAKVENVTVSNFTGNGINLVSSYDGNTTDTNSRWQTSTVYTDGDWVLARGHDIGLLDVSAATLTLARVPDIARTAITITRSTPWAVTPTVGLALEIPVGSILAGTASATGSTASSTGTIYATSGMTLNTPIVGLGIGDGLEVSGTLLRVEDISADGLTVYTDKTVPGGSGLAVNYAANVNAGTYYVGYFEGFSGPITSTVITAFKSENAGASYMHRSGDYVTTPRAIPAVAQTSVTNVAVSQYESGRFVCVVGGTSAASGIGPQEAAATWPTPGTVTDGTCTWRGTSTGTLGTFTNATSSGTTITVPSGGVNTALLRGIMKMNSGTGTLSTYTTAVTAILSSTQFTVSEAPAVALSGTNSFTIYGSSLSTGNINNFYIGYCTVNDCDENGIYCNGADSNAGVGIMNDLSVNHGWGIYDNSFLGNTWLGCHTSQNSLGPYRNNAAGNCYSTFLGCYAEGSQGSGDMIFSPGNVMGGIHASEVHSRTNTLFILGNSMTPHSVGVTQSGKTITTTIGRSSQGAGIFAGIVIEHTDDYGFEIGRYLSAIKAFSIGHINSGNALYLYGVGSQFFGELGLGGFRFQAAASGSRGVGTTGSPSFFAANGNPMHRTLGDCLLEKGDIAVVQNRAAYEPAFYVASQRMGVKPVWAAGSQYYGNTGATPTAPNGYVYRRAGGAGVTTGAVEPTWPTPIGSAPFTEPITGLVWECYAVSVNPTWTASASYPGNAAVVPTQPNGYTYQRTSGATSTGVVEPTWPLTIGGTVTDSNGLVWICYALSANNADAVYPYGLILDSTSAPGAITQSSLAGRVSIGAGNSSIVVTNTLVSATTIIGYALQTVDGTLTQILSCVPAAGSFTIRGNANATGTTKIAWWIIK